MKYNRRQSYYDAPINVNIALTERCNLQCPFCFHEYGCGTDLEFPLLKSYLEQLAKMGTYCVQYSGGDPLLYPYLDEAIECSHKWGLYTRLSTSGSELTFAYAKRLKKAQLFILKQFLYVWLFFWKLYIFFQNFFRDLLI